MLRWAISTIAFAGLLLIGRAADAQYGGYESLPNPGGAPNVRLDTIVVEPEAIDGPYRAMSPIGPAPGMAPGMPGGAPPWGANLFGPPRCFGRPPKPPYGYPPSTVLGCEPPWIWQVVPDGLIYRSYLAGPREARLAVIPTYDISQSRWIIDGTLGGRVALLRYGTEDPLLPRGFEIDVETAAFPRIDTSTSSWDLETVDFRWGVPLTYGVGPWEFKLAYYHLSAHLGDEYIINHIDDFTRINYVRDAVVLGVAYRIREAIRLYGEAGYAFHTDGGAEPWEFQVGAEYSQMEPTGLRGSPFFAVNGWLRQEVNYGGSLTAQAGWQWRGYGSGHLLRVGAQYFLGRSVAFEFFRNYEKLIGLGVWYDY